MSPSHLAMIKVKMLHSLFTHGLCNTLLNICVTWSNFLNSALSQVLHKTGTVVMFGLDQECPAKASCTQKQSL